MLIDPAFYRELTTAKDKYEIAFVAASKARKGLQKLESYERETLVLYMSLLRMAASPPSIPPQSYPPETIEDED